MGKATRRILRLTHCIHAITSRHQAQFYEGGLAVVSSDAVGIEGVPTVWTLTI
jgi:hypothetical protein